MARYVPRPEPGAFPAGLLAILVHVALAVVLVIGLRWQTKPPAASAVEVELVRPPAVEAPRFVPPPEPRVEVKPPPEPPAPKPEPKVEPPPPKPAPKPDIAIEKEKKALEAKRIEDEKKRADEKRREDEKKRVAEEKRREADAKAEQARIDEQLRRELDRDQTKAQQDQLAREMETLRAEQARRDAAAKAAAAAGDAKARSEWADRIRAKIKPLIVMPDGIVGNPEALFDVVLLPSGDVVSARLRRSSGNKAYDDAVERAILKASPLPRPERAEVFVRDLALRFRPND